MSPAQSALARPAHARLPGLRRLILAVVRAIARAQTHRRERTQLLDMSDRELRDIGVSRADAVRASREWRR
jgi:uncharacterized protein YjiS (DUF1127 family)